MFVSQAFIDLQQQTINDLRAQLQQRDTTIAELLKTVMTMKVSGAVVVTPRAEAAPAKVVVIPEIEAALDRSRSCRNLEVRNKVRAWGESQLRPDRSNLEAVVGRIVNWDYVPNADEIEEEDDDDSMDDSMDDEVPIVAARG